MYRTVFISYLKEFPKLPIGIHKLSLLCPLYPLNHVLIDRLSTILMIYYMLLCMPLFKLEMYSMAKYFLSNVYKELFYYVCLPLL